MKGQRKQLEFRASDLDSLLPEGHRARLVWAYVEQANRAPIYAEIKVLIGGSGHAAIAPEILFALWLYATIEGVGSARAIDRLTESDDAYRWICGGVAAPVRAAREREEKTRQAVARLPELEAIKAR